MQKRLSHCILFIFSLLLTLLSCTDKMTKADRGSDIQRSFCYWDTEYKEMDYELLNTLGANHMYIRYFDIDWDGVSNEAKPIASIYDRDSLPMHFTPSIFLTNKVFIQSTREQLDSLSVRMKRRIDYITEEFAKTHTYRYLDGYGNNQLLDSIKLSYQQQRYKDLLIDCDWTAGTRDNFFYFLKKVQEDIPDKEITVTLRLWQYKQQEKKDIPPIHRCLLMCYNMQMVNDFNVVNSIGSLDELKKYVSGAPYPLSLDVALPVFSWGALFRNEQFIGLLGNITEDNLRNNFIEFNRMGNGQYRVLTDKVLNNYFIRNGDIIRIEMVAAKELEQIAHYLQQTIPMKNDSRVTFFSWKNSYINNYGTDEIKKLYTIFGK